MMHGTSFYIPRDHIPSAQNYVQGLILIDMLSNNKKERIHLEAQLMKSDLGVGLPSEPAPSILKI